MVLRFFSRKSGPPSPSDAVSRAIILKHLLVTAMATPPPDILSAVSSSSTATEHQAFLEELRERRRDSVSALQESGLWDLMSPVERSFLTASPEVVPEQRQKDVSWLMEAAECLLWALGHVEALPPYDAQADIEHLK